MLFDLFRNHAKLLESITFYKCKLLSGTYYNFLQVFKKRRNLWNLSFEQTELSRVCYYQLTAVARSSKITNKL
jgi:hypothetical protein